MQFLLTWIVSGFLQKTVSSTKDGEDFLRLFTASNSFEVLSQQCSTEDEPQIKICLYCVSILMRVTQEVTKRLSNSGTEILYKQLYRKMEEVHEMRPKFLHAATCLSKVCHIMRIFNSIATIKFAMAFWSCRFIEPQQRPGYQNLCYCRFSHFCSAIWKLCLRVVFSFCFPHKMKYHK